MKIVMKKYNTIMFLMVAIIIGVVLLIVTPEFYVNPEQRVEFSELAFVPPYDEEMHKIQREIDLVQLQPTVASTLGQVLVLPQPDMPNHFVVVKNPVPKDYISYSTTHI